MEKDKLYTYIKHPALLNTSTLEELEGVVNDYPYFQSARLLYTKNLQVTDSEQYGEELGKTAVVCSDRKKLFYFIQSDRYKQFLHSSEDNQPGEEDRTETLLNSYLKEVDKKETTETGDEETTLNIVSTDYFTYLESLGIDTATEQTENQPLQHQDIIDAFIERKESDTLHTSPHTNSTRSNEDETETGDNKIGNEFLTETLAKIYIKQKKYEQAVTVIKRLSLNFPKKNAYFADQIRFLEYLIINEKNK